MEGVSIDRISEDAILQGEKVVTYVSARYRIGDAGPFTARVVKSDHWQDDLRAAIAIDQRNLNTLQA